MVDQAGPSGGLRRRDNICHYKLQFAQVNQVFPPNVSFVDDLHQRVGVLSCPLQVVPAGGHMFDLTVACDRYGRQVTRGLARKAAT